MHIVEEAPQFNDEWNRRARTEMQAHAGRPRIDMGRHVPSDNYRHSHSQAPLAITAGPSHESDHHRSRTHPRGVGPDRHARKRDGGYRSSKSRHETSM